MNNQQLNDRDLDVLWHPCTQMKDHEWLPMIPIRSGKGVWLEDFDGHRYIDAISSWWVNIFGHCNDHINAAIARQMQQLEHVIMAGFSHESAISLAEKLVAITPPGLERVFFADNGSAAVEVALKMSFHYWLNSGQPHRTQFISLANGYHGETLGALSVGDVPLYKETYGPLLMNPVVAPSPDAFTGEPGESPREVAVRALQAMQKLLEEHHNTTCAVIVEPLVQCAGNMRMYHPHYLSGLRELCDRYEVHLIVDEIAVGFGRTGTMFACEQANISPDFMCLSKGLTGGYLPMSAVLTHDSVYQAFYHDYDSLKGFLHSHSYTGHALGCAAALATLELFEREPVIEQNRKTASLMADLVADLHDHARVGDIRQTGMILAMEMCQDKQTRAPFPWQQRRGLKVYQYALEQGVLLRPMGNVVYFMPPYVINEDEIRLMARTAIDGIHLATAD
jgi:adenosylmethionine-8-amino-7-oxononanoate aminotransferase